MSVSQQKNAESTLDPLRILLGVVETQFCGRGLSVFFIALFRSLKERHKNIKIYPPNCFASTRPPRHFTIRSVTIKTIVTQHISTFLLLILLYFCNRWCYVSLPGNACLTDHLLSHNTVHALNTSYSRLNYQYLFFLWKIILWV